MKQTIILGNIITMDEKRPFSSPYTMQKTKLMNPPHPPLVV